MWMQLSHNFVRTRRSSMGDRDEIMMEQEPFVAKKSEPHSAVSSLGKKLMYNHHLGVSGMSPIFNSRLAALRMVQFLLQDGYNDNFPSNDYYWMVSRSRHGWTNPYISTAEIPRSGSMKEATRPQNVLS